MKKSVNKWIAFDFTSPKEPSKLKRTNKTASRVSKPTILNINLLEKLKPRTIEQLAVHPKKIKDVQVWLEQHACKKRTNSVLLLTGPTGSGKTATIKVLCNTMGLQLMEWINPIDQDFELPFYQSQAARFIEFFMQSKYTSLCSNSTDNRRVVLVEDFPNFLIQNSLQFGETLRRCLGGGFPVVFICTDASSGKLDLSQKLFSQELKEEFNITTISFNPCSATILKSALKRAQSVIETEKDLFCVPSADVVDAIISSTMGDIRCAINQYQFACLKGIQTKIPISSTLNSSRGSKRKRNTTSIKSMLKDEKLGFFHGLGRVLNPKCVEVNNSWRIQCDFNTLIEQFSTQPTMFNSFLQENYLNYFGELGDVQKAADILSQAQIFLDNWDERHDTMWYALWIAVLGLMVYNKHKVSKWNQIKAPTKNKPRPKGASNGYLVNHTDSLYYNIIKNNNEFHTFKV